MTVVSFRKKVVRRRRRRFIPRKRLFKAKSLYPRRTIYIHKGRFRLFKHREPMPRLFRRFNTFVLPTGRTRPYSQSHTPKPLKKIPSFKLDKIKGKWQSDWNKKKKAWAGDEKKTDEPWKKVEKKIKIQYEPYWKKKDITWLPRFGAKGFVFDRRGGDTSKFRKYKDYGPMKALGPRLIFELTPTIKYSQYYKRRKGSLDIDKVLYGTKKAMEKVLDELKIYAKEIINRYVPEETGDLRKAMIDSIQKSEVHRFRMKVELDTGNIKYANPVNHMPQRMIRHDMAWGVIGRRSGVSLHDPKAVKGWFDFIDMLLNTKAKKLLYDMISDVITAWSYKIYKKTSPSLMPKRGGSIVDPAIVLPATTGRKGGYTIREGTKYFKAKRYKTGEGKTIEDKEMAKHIRMVQLRLNKERREKEAETMYYSRNLIKGFFKIKGLNKA